MPSPNIAQGGNSNHNIYQILNTFVVPGSKLFYMAYILILPKPTETLLTSTSYR